jgi:hypothetical protein
MPSRRLNEQNERAVVLAGQIRGNGFLGHDGPLSKDCCVKCRSGGSTLPAGALNMRLFRATVNAIGAADMSTKIEIVLLDGEQATLQVNYGSKQARLEIAAPPLFDRQPPTEACRHQVIELSEALEVWFAQGGAIVDSRVRL